VESFTFSTASDLFSTATKKMFEAYPSGFIDHLVDDVIELYETAVKNDEDISYLAEDPKYAANDETKRAFKALLEDVREVGEHYGLTRNDHLRRNDKAEFFSSLNEYYMTFYRDGEDIIEPAKIAQIFQDAIHNYTDENEWDERAAEWFEKQHGMVEVLFKFLHKSARSDLVASLRKVFDFGDKCKRSALEQYVDDVPSKKKKSSSDVVNA
jgi:hypothetical protein